MKRTPSVWTTILALSGALLGCGSSAGPLEARAAHDLNCSQDQVVVTELGGKSYGVSGCGKKATYTEVCTPKPGSFSGDCDWSQSSQPQDPE